MHFVGRSGRYGPWRGIAVAIALVLAAAPAAAAGIESCEKIKDADAYNSCLAAFGPAAGAHPVTQAPREERVSEAPRRRGRKTETPKRGAKRQAHGRVRIEIYPGH